MRIAPVIILSVLLESGQPITKTRLMKLLFLIRQETEVGTIVAFYDFLPYKFGPYSFFADRDLRSLMSEGLVAGQKLSISDENIDIAFERYRGLSGQIRSQIKRLTAHYRTWPDHRLLEDIYTRYPAYALLSERPGRKPERIIAPPAAYTIGYEGVSVEAFLNTFIRLGIARLVDVRHNPVSRRYGFSKKTLSNLCEKVGIEYIHIPELGIPSEER